MQVFVLSDAANIPIGVFSSTRAALDAIPVRSVLDTLSFDPDTGVADVTRNGADFDYFHVNSLVLDAVPALA